MEVFEKIFDKAILNVKNNSPVEEVKYDGEYINFTVKNSE